jgi:hypothetical protein
VIAVSAASDTSIAAHTESDELASDQATHEGLAQLGATQQDQVLVEQDGVSASITNTEEGSKNSIEFSSETSTQVRVSEDINISIDTTESASASVDTDSATPTVTLNGQEVPLEDGRTTRYKEDDGENELKIKIRRDVNTDEEDGTSTSHINIETSGGS